jgi:hypothetical protein
LTWLADTVLQGAVGLASLAVTLIGFGVAIWQILRVKSAAKAAKDSADATRISLQQRIGAFELSAAISDLISAKVYLQNSNRDGGRIYIDLARSKIVMVRESLTVEDASNQALADVLRDINIVLDQLSQMGGKLLKQDFTAYVQSLNRVQEQLTQTLAPLRLG